LAAALLILVVFFLARATVSGVAWPAEVDHSATRAPPNRSWTATAARIRRPAASPGGIRPWFRPHLPPSPASRVGLRALPRSDGRRVAVGI
jgi:hypothetical protein